MKKILEWIKNLDSKTKKIIIIVAAVVLVLAIGFCFLWSKLGLIQRSDGELQGEFDKDAVEEMLEGEDLTEEELEDLEQRDIIYRTGATISDSNVVNILLIGTDERQNEFTDLARSDSMILMSLDFKDSTIKMVSFQRGMGVPILRGEYEGEYDWLTHSFNYGGASLLIDELEYCFGVKIDHFVRVNFYTFEQIVDAVGGVTVNIESSVADALNGITDNDAVTRNWVTTGENTLCGYDALQFSRVRHCDSDWQRVERQRQVIQSLMNKAKEMSFVELTGMLDVVLPLVQTDMSRTEMINLLMRAPQLISSSTAQMTLPLKGTYGSMYGMGGRSLYAVDFKTNAQALIDFFYN